MDESFVLLMVYVSGSGLDSEEMSANFQIYAGLFMSTVRMRQKG